MLNRDEGNPTVGIEFDEWCNITYRSREGLLLAAVFTFIIKGDFVYSSLRIFSIEIDSGA